MCVTVVILICKCPEYRDTTDNNDADSDRLSNYVSARPHEPQESPGREGSPQKEEEERGGRGGEKVRKVLCG